MRRFDRHVDALLRALEQHGELPRSSLQSHSQVPAGSLPRVCRHLVDKGRLIERAIPNPGGRPRFAYRLPDQPAKEAYDPRGVLLGHNALRRRTEERRAQQEAAEQRAAGEHGSLAQRVTRALAAAGDAGLRMADIPAAVQGDEPADQVKDKVRALWAAGQLARRPDGTFIVASTRAWRVAELEDAA